MSTDLTLPPDNPPAPRSRGGKSKNNIVAFTQATLRPFTASFDIAGFCNQLGRGYSLNGHHISIFEGIHSSVSVEDAKVARDLLWHKAVQLKQAIEHYESFIDPDPEDEIKPAIAAIMVKGLFNAIAGKKKSEEDQTKQEACILMFDPVIGAIGADTQLWGDIPRHPVIVALAISSMMYKTDGKRFPGFSESGDYEALKFCPAPSELAAACKRTRTTLRQQLGYMQKLMGYLCRVEEALFTMDRHEWASFLTTQSRIDAAIACSDCFCSNPQSEKYREWSDALDNVEGELHYNMLREIINKDGRAPLTEADVQEGEPVPDGITPLPLPPALIERLPHMETCNYFITPQQIVFVEKGKCIETLKRFAD